MNSRDEVFTRLLRLYPIRIVKNRFREVSIGSFTDYDIQTFAYNNFDFTKQHTYLLLHKIPDINRLPEHILTENSERIVGTNYIIYQTLYKLTYQIFLQDPFNTVSCVFS
jgi:hypothetical protein